MIYKSVHNGWYSVTDECFYTASQVEDRRNSNGNTIKVSKETESLVEWTSEENYCFRLSMFRDKLRRHYEANPNAIVPRNYYEDVLLALSEPLQDISISRPKSRLSWGIEVPGDPGQVIYVWFDALINYLTATGYPWPSPEAGNRGGWPVRVHVIGKDIVRYTRSVSGLP